MKLLIDTETLLWWLEGDARLSDEARCAVASPENEVFVSAASAFEIADMAHAGALAGGPQAARRLAEAIGSQGFRALEVNFGHALRAGALGEANTMDRLIAAQALAGGMRVVSMNEAFDRLGVARVW